VRGVNKLHWLGPSQPAHSPSNERKSSALQMDVKDKLNTMYANHGGYRVLLDLANIHYRAIQPQS